MNIYDIGDQVRLSVAFSDDEGAAVDPTVVTLTYAGPGGSEIELTYDGENALTRDGPGSYYVDIVPQTAGTWRYRWAGSGAVTAATEGQFEVRRSFFA